MLRAPEVMVGVGWKARGLEGDGVLLPLIVLVVLAGLVLLIVGALGSGLLLLWLAVLCAAVAGVMLIVFTQLRRHRGRPLSTASPVVAGPAVVPPAPPAPTSGRHAETERQLDATPAPPDGRPAETDSRLDGDERITEWRDVGGDESTRGP